MSSSFHLINVVCTQVFSQVIGDSSDGVAQSRLIQLYLPKAESEWRCQYSQATEPDGADASEKAHSGRGLTSMAADGAREHVELHYKVSDVNVACGYRCLYHASPELLDFQSNVVLANTTDKAVGAVQNVIEKFLQQFSWMRRMAGALSSLHMLGHFLYYPSYSFVISSSCSPDAFKAAVLEKEAALTVWQQFILSTRNKFYFINYFDVKRCYALILKLEAGLRSSALTGPTNPEFQELVAQYVCVLSVDAADDDSVVAAVSGALVESWAASSSHEVSASRQQSMSASGPLLTSAPIGGHASGAAEPTELFRRFAAALEASMVLVPLRVRRISFLDFESYASVGHINPGTDYCTTLNKVLRKATNTTILLYFHFILI